MPSLARAAAVRQVRVWAYAGVTLSAAALLLLVAMTVYLIRAGRSPRPAPPVPTASVAPVVESASAEPVASVAPSASVPPVVAKYFTRGSALAALDAVNAELGSCRSEGALTGAGSVRVTFTNDGTVTNIVLRAPYAGTKEGECVADLFRGARMGPFKGAHGTINYMFKVPVSSP